MLMSDQPASSSWGRLSTNPWSPAATRVMTTTTMLAGSRDRTSARAPAAPLTAATSGYATRKPSRT